MRILAPALFAAAVLLPTSLAADVLVMADGRVFEVGGPILFQGDFVHFKMPTSGQEVTFRRFEVDENKTRSLNQVLDSDVHGLPRLRKIEGIEAQRTRAQGRSIAMVEERPPIQEIKEAAMERLPTSYPERTPVYYPSGDVPVTVQPHRVSRETIGREAAEEKMRTGEAPRAPAARAPERAPAGREEDRAALREQRRMEREAAQAAREAELEAARRERESERAARAAERETTLEARRAREEAEERAAPRRELSDTDQVRAEAYRDRIAAIDEQIGEARGDLRRLTDLQRDAEAEFEGQRLRSVDDEIDRLLRRIERLEARKQSLETRLQQLEAD